MIDELCGRAEKALRGNFLSKLFGKGRDLDEAQELYVKAGILARQNMEWRRAGECYLKAAEVSAMSDDTGKTAQLYTDAGHMLNRVNTDEAKVVYDKAVSTYMEIGRFQQAARVLRQLADSFEEQNDQLSAMEYYKKAADAFSMDEYGKAASSACRLKYAKYTAKIEDNLHTATQIFEEEAKKMTKNSTLQFGAKEHFLNAGLLKMLTCDTTDMNITLERYRQFDSRFEGSREGRFLSDLVHAVSENDIEAFTNVIGEYDRITPLDEWRAHFLYKAKDKLFTGEGRKGEEVNLADSDGELDLS